MTSFFLIVSFHLDKSNFQVFVFNSSSQFHGIKEKELYICTLYINLVMWLSSQIIAYPVELKYTIRQILTTGTKEAN